MFRHGATRQHLDEGGWQRGGYMVGRERGWQRGGRVGVTVVTEWGELFS